MAAVLSRVARTTLIGRREVLEARPFSDERESLPSDAIRAGYQTHPATRMPREISAIESRMRLTAEGYQRA